MFENDLYVGGNLTGSGSALTLDMSNGPALFLENETEVGPVAIDGTNPSEPGIFNGAVFFGGALNSSDGHPVSLNHIFLTGSGAVGPLTTEAAELAIGSGAYPAEGIEATSVKLDSASFIGFEISHAGVAAKEDNSQLASQGAIELKSAKLEVVLRPPEEGKPCPTLVPGQTYTFVSTTGTLLGSFSNAPEGGAEIPINFAKACSQLSQTMQIAYNRSGGTETVTGTVEEAKAKQEAKEAKEKQEKEARERQEAKERQEAREKQEAKERQETNERLTKEAEARKSQETAEAATKKHQEEEAAINHKHEEEAAAAKKKQEEENAPTGSVSLDGSTISVQSSGAAGFKLTCTGTGTCDGKLTLTAKGTAKKGKKAKGETIGRATFSIPPGTMATIQLKLNSTGRALLSANHGRLNAILTVLKSSPGPAQTHTESARLVQHKAHK